MKTKAIILLLALSGLMLSLRLGLHNRAERLPAPIEEIASMNSQEPCVFVDNPRPESTEGAPSRRTSELQSALDMMLQRFTAEPDLDRRSEMVQQLAESLAEADLLPTLNALAQSDIIGPGVELRQLLLRRWTAIAPDQAADWAAASIDPSLRSEQLLQVAAVWAESDWARAVRWFKALPDDNAKVTGLLTLAYEGSRVEPVNALNLAVDLPANEERAQLLEHGVRQWSATNPSAAVAWAANISDQPLRDRLVAAISTASAELFPVESANLSLRFLTAAGLQEQSVVSIVQRWIQTDPVTTADWVAGFPEGGLRDASARNMVEIWSATDPAGVAAWLNGLPAGSLRDVGQAAFARGIAPMDFSAALAWADEVGDPLSRVQSREAVLRLTPPVTE